MRLNNLLVYVFLSPILAAVSAFEVLLLISSQDTPQHRQRSHALRQELLQQLDTIPQDYVINIQIMHEIFNYPGDWTILATLPHLIGETRLLNDNTKWIILCKDNTHVSLQRLLDRLKQENSEQLSFWGYPLYDHEATIIHHFAFFKNPRWFWYPQLSAGVIFTGNLLRSLAKLVADADERQILRPSEFSIDAAHELARFIFDNLTPESPKVQQQRRRHKVQNNDDANEYANGSNSSRNGDIASEKKSQKIILKSAAYICPMAPMASASVSAATPTTMTTTNLSLSFSKAHATASEDCLMYAKAENVAHSVAMGLGNGTAALSCLAATTGSEHIYFAIKTCYKFHKERVPIVESTWAAYAVHRKYFTDIADSSIVGHGAVAAMGTGIPNVETGHCAKTLAILQLSLKDIEQMKRKRDGIVDIRWLLLVDDDTLLSVSRLSELLSCYDHTADIYLGERYGYRLHAPDGFNYITGGGGIAMSLPFVRRLLEHCSCPAPTAPDDMILGYCAQAMGVRAIHSNQFHQARPQDYPKLLLQQNPLPISFHKFWQLDPRKVYESWFGMADRSMWQLARRRVNPLPTNVTRSVSRDGDGSPQMPLRYMLKQERRTLHSALESVKSAHLDL